MCFLFNHLITSCFQQIAQGSELKLSPFTWSYIWTSHLICKWQTIFTLNTSLYDICFLSVYISDALHTAEINSHVDSISSCRTYTSAPLQTWLLYFRSSPILAVVAKWYIPTKRICNSTFVTISSTLSSISVVHLFWHFAESTTVWQITILHINAKNVQLLHISKQICVLAVIFKNKNMDERLQI